MSFENFKKRISDLVEKSGEEIKVTFKHDEESGKHIAICTNGVRFFGNSKSLKLTVRFGSGHQAMV